MLAQRITSARLSSIQRPNASCLSSISRNQPRNRVARLNVQNLFTGIVQGTANVHSILSTPGFSRLAIAFPPGKMSGIQIGASVAINGTCLTVTNIGLDGDSGSASNNDTLSFDVMSETLRATSLGGLSSSSVVNFERSARMGDEIGGHNVSGHVHSTASIIDVLDTENNRRVTYELTDSKWSKYVLSKGYIAVDGCSLTVGEVKGPTFCVYLIPETLRVTVHGVKTVGDMVNIEIESQTQAIIDTVERVVAQMAGAGQLAA